MADVVGGGTANVTLYDEDGAPLGTPANRVETAAVLLDHLGTEISTSNRLPVDLGGAVEIGNLAVQYESKESLANHADAPLAAGQVYVGGWEDVRDYAAISAAVFTDAPSAVNGVVIEFSEDGTDAGWVRSVATTIPANVGTHFSLGPQARFFRIRYTNGATAQTIFRNQILLKFQPPAQVQQPLGAPTTDANLGTIVRSHLSGRQKTGQWTGVEVNSLGNVSTRVPDLTALGTVQAVDSSVVLLSQNGGLSAFSFDITGFTTGVFVIERTLHPTPTDPSALWTTVGAFKAGTRTSAGRWVNSPGAYHGNMSASTAVRIRVVTALNAPALIHMLGGAGTGTITIGAIASNEGNVIGATQSLSQLYATTAGGNISWNSSIDVITQSSTGEQVVAALVNPAGSGIDMFIDTYELNSSSTSTWRRYRNATLSALGTAQINVNRGGDQALTNAGRLYRGAGSTTQDAAAQVTRTGGIMGKAGFIAANTPKIVELNGAVRLRPGQNWVFTTVGPGGLGGNHNLTFFADWWEAPST